MISPGGFNSILTSYRGLMAAQVGLDVTNHNISNANTEGYSRQRINLHADNPYTEPTVYQMTQQLGNGVSVKGIDRIRNSHYDLQYRTHTSNSSMTEEYSEVLGQIEGILNSLSNSGLNDQVQNFFNTMQELSLNPESATARNNTLQQANQMINVFQTQAQQLMDLQNSMVGTAGNATSVQNSQVNTLVGQVNNLLNEVQELNGEIITITASGGQPNDLYDKRDLILDKLSEFVDISYTLNSNGTADISIAGQEMVRNKSLVNTLQVTLNAGPAPDPDFQPATISTVNGGFDILNNAAPNTVTGGKIKAIVNAAGGDTTQSNVRGSLEALDTMLRTLATSINAIQTSGRDLSGAVATENIFLPQPPAAGTLEIMNYRVNPTVLADPSLIATAAGPPAAYLGPGDGSNALSMAQVNDTNYAGLGNETIVGYFNSLTANLGIDRDAYDSRTENSAVILQNIEENKQREMGVNMEEEFTNILRFQRAFEASSRMISTYDEILQTIMNMV